jgi:hypothetical protein
MSALEPELERIGALLKDAIDADLAKGRAARLVSVRARFQRASRSLRWLALVCSAGLAATVLAIAFVGGSEQFAFAGWSAHPTKPAVGQLTSADTDCQGSLAKPSPSGTDLGSLVPEVSDVRGPYTVTVFGNASQKWAMCISGPGGNATLQWITWSDPSYAPVGSGAIALDRTNVLSDSGQPFTLVEGRTGDAVTGVALTLENGNRVTATVGHGFFLAWWPGTVSSTAVVVSTASGSSTQSVAPASSSGSNSVCRNQSCGSVVPPGS